MILNDHLPLIDPRVDLHTLSPSTLSIVKYTLPYRVERQIIFNSDIPSTAQI